MRYKRIIAAVLCLSLVCGTGCSLGKNSSSKTVGSSSFSSTTKKYDLSYFSFELSEDFSVKDTKDYNDGSDTYNYIFTGGGLDEVSVYTMGLEQCTAEVSVQAMMESIKSNENDTATDIETEKLDVTGFNAAAIHMTNSRDDGDKGESHLYLSTEGIQFCVSVTSYAPDNRDNIKALFREIAKTVKYTGSDHLPTEPQSYDCEYFSLKCGPEWYIKKNKITDGEYADVKLSYYYAQDLEHYYTPLLAISVRAEDEDTDPQKAADKAYESKKESRLISELKRGNEEIFGYQAETVSFVLVTGSIKIRYTNYYISENGCLYTVSEGFNMLNEDSSKTELKAILDSISIKKFTDEELAKRQQELEAAAYQDIGFCGAEFRLDSKFKCERDYEDGKTYHHTKKDMYIELLHDDSYNGSFDDYFQKQVNTVCLMNGINGVTSHRVILANNARFEVMDYRNKRESEAYGKDMKCSVYYYERDGKMFKFTIGYPETDEETAISIIEEMLSSMSFE